MADSYYKLVGHRNSTTNWTTEVVLERGDDGEPTKVIRAGEPTKLSAEDRKKVESLGFTVEDSSAKEAEETAVVQQPGGDVAGASPVFGNAGPTQQAQPSLAAQTDQGSSSVKSNDDK